LKVTERDRTDRGADKFQDLTIHRLDHAANLTIAPLGNRKFQMGVFARIAYAANPGRARGSIAQRDAAA